MRGMLGALRWTPETIDHAIAFLKQPLAPEDAKPPNPIDVSDAPPEVPKPVSIKQNPFPIGSPLLKNARHHEELHAKTKHPFLRGAVAGVIVLIAGLVLYARLGASGR